jgi:hypothetical protein
MDNIAITTRLIIFCHFVLFSIFLIFIRIMIHIIKISGMRIRCVILISLVIDPVDVEVSIISYFPGTQYRLVIIFIHDLCSIILNSSSHVSSSIVLNHVNSGTCPKTLDEKEIIVIHNVVKIAFILLRDFFMDYCLIVNYTSI